MDDLELELMGQLESIKGNTACGAGLRAQGRIIDWVTNKLTTNPELKERLKAVALNVFDSYDIPYIDGYVEATVKQTLRPFLVELLNQLLGA